jgi:hypothetical protein
MVEINDRYGYVKLELSRKKFDIQNCNCTNLEVPEKNILNLGFPLDFDPEIEK